MNSFKERSNVKRLMYWEDDLLLCGEVKWGQSRGKPSRYDSVEGDVGKKWTEERFGLQLELIGLIDR